MDVLSNPQTRQALFIGGGVVLLVLILMTLYFFWRRVHKIRYLAKKDPDRAQSYNGFLLFLNYIGYALLVFIVTALVASVPLVAAIYLGLWLAHNVAPLVPLITGGVCLGLVLGYYVTFKFLRSKVAFEESKAVPTITEFVA
ncbi:hypothetical protein ccbrp13_03870 [Ktedonobacteria bacterium brp13]|nr:hypothetical protein ccbrp13_03870 [Ktedonobacteria bacterium brp13]